MTIKVQENQNLVKAGLDITKQGKEQHKKKLSYSKGQIDQAAKEIATGICGVARGRVSFYPNEWNAEWKPETKLNVMQS